MNSSAEQQSVTSKTIAGIKWSYVSMGLMAALQLIIISVLAHLLTPHEFGLVGIALIFINFADRFGELGVSHALIQRAELSDDHPRVGFTIAIIMGVFISFILWCLAPAIAEFFGEQELLPVVKAVSLMIVIESFGVVSRSILQREIKLKEIALIENLAYFLGNGALAISLAFLGFGVWALVYGYLAGRLIKSLLYFLKQPQRPLFSIFSATGRELISMGTGFSLVRLINYLALQGDNFVVGRLLGASQLGIYTRAYQLMSMPGKYFGDALDKALFPAMARKQADSKKLRNIFIYSIESTALVAIPATVFLWLTAGPVVSFLFGPNWTEVVSVLQILSLGVFFRSAYKSCDTLVRSLGRPYRHALRQGLYAAAVIAGAALGSYWGLNGVALGILVAVTLNYFVMSQFACELLGLTFKNYLHGHLPVLWQALVITVGLYFTTWLLAELIHTSALIVFTNFIVALVFLTLALLIAPTPCKLKLAPWVLSKISDNKQGKLVGAARSILVRV